MKPPFDRKKTSSIQQHRQSPLASMFDVRCSMFDVLPLARAACLLSLFAVTALAKDITYSNPVLPGDFPDPSVVRVGADYWTVSRSSYWGPI
jgi:hypothetical protein